MHYHIRIYVACLMYEEESNHPSGFLQSFPLLMEKWEGSSMDLFTKLSTIYGKDCVLMFIYQITIFVHSFAIHLQHIALQESISLCGFHGPFWTTFSDGDEHFIEDVGQYMFFFDNIKPIPNILYYFQAFEKLMAVRKWLDGHLAYHILRHQEEE